MIGSIGVIFSSFGLEQLISKWGITRRVSTAGNRKSFMDPFTPEKEEDKEAIKQLLASFHENFKDHVRQNRGDRIKVTAIGP